MFHPRIKKTNSIKMNWSGMEVELREILREYNQGQIDPRFALLCIDEVVARYTRRGNEIEINDEDYQEMKDLFPAFFNWQVEVVTNLPR